MKNQTHTIKLSNNQTIHLVEEKDKLTLVEGEPDRDGYYVLSITPDGVTVMPNSGPACQYITAGLAKQERTRCIVACHRDGVVDVVHVVVTHQPDDERGWVKTAAAESLSLSDGMYVVIDEHDEAFKSFDFNPTHRVSM